MSPACFEDVRPTFTVIDVVIRLGLPENQRAYPPVSAKALPFERLKRYVSNKPMGGASRNRPSR